MAEIAGVDIAGVDNGEVSRHGIQRRRRFHRVELSSRLTVFLAVFLVSLSRIVALVRCTCAFNSARPAL